MVTNVVIEVDTASPARTRVVDDERAGLPGGFVRLRVDRLAITANTVTYALVGDLLGYWEFFPTDDPVFGRVPAMGWADVVESTHPEVPTGDRLYGWFPMAGFVDLEVSPMAAGLRDDGAHRHDHAGVYRTYVRTSSDPMYPDLPAGGEALGDAEDRHALLRGLFLTGFLADAFLDDRAYLGAEQVVVLSASSKTAIGFAHQASQRDLAVVGMTSTVNLDFVRSLGLYDQVVTYDEVDRLVVAPSVSVDMSGNRPALAALHDRLGERLAHSMVIGNSHQDTSSLDITAGPAPQLFFAPTAVSRLAETWGREDYERRTTAALARFVTGSEQWLVVERTTGVAAAEATWHEVVAGSVPAHVGRIVSLHP
ncbi:DUF2855 family protein [soil metagenome]